MLRGFIYFSVWLFDSTQLMDRDMFDSSLHITPHNRILEALLGAGMFRLGFDFPGGGALNL